MDVPAWSSLVLRISTLQQQLQDNRINTQKMDIDGCRAWQALWHWPMPLKLIDCFFQNLPLCTFLSILGSGQNMEAGKHKIQIMKRIYNTNTLPVFRHTQPKSMETEAYDWSHCNNRHLFYIFTFLYPLWADKWTVTLALLRAGQQAEGLGVNHGFVLLSWHIKLARWAVAPDVRVRDGRTMRKSLNNDASLPHHFED